MVLSWAMTQSHFSPAAQWEVRETRDEDLGGVAGERTCGCMTLKETWK